MYNPLKITHFKCTATNRDGNNNKIFLMNTPTQYVVENFRFVIRTQANFDLEKTGSCTAFLKYVDIKNVTL